MGDWKLVRMKTKGKSQAVVTLKTRDESQAPLHRLYHLPDDPAELKDVSAGQPERLKAMIAKMDEIVSSARTRK